MEGRSRKTMSDPTDFIRSIYLTSPKTIAALLWHFSEASGIPLGESDALILGVAIGCSGMQKVVGNEGDRQG